MSTCFLLNARTQAALASVKRGDIFRTDSRISVSFFNLTIMNWEIGGSEFHHIECFLLSSNRITCRKSTIEGKNGYTKTRIADFPQGNSHIFVRGQGKGILLYSHFSAGKFYYEKSWSFCVCMCVCVCVCVCVLGWGRLGGLLEGKSYSMTVAILFDYCLAFHDI